MAAKAYQKQIKTSGLTIYDELVGKNSSLLIPTKELEKILNKSLRGLDLSGLALRTRAKIIKTEICGALGYPIPSSFQKTQPRFPAQMCDVYVQKSNNLQIWNEEIAPERRYVLIKLSESDIVERARVIEGVELASLDTTGTLTHKYQAQMLSSGGSVLLSKDTKRVQKILENESERIITSPDDFPTISSLMSIEEIFERLSPLVGASFQDSGITRERSRGDLLHSMVSKALGYDDHHDNGQFPDVRNQLLEVKLQTSPTIDLGLIKPDSTEVLDFPKLGKIALCHEDVRYALFGGKNSNSHVTLTRLFIVAGKDFFKHFRQFQGKVQNKKIQIPLPRDFFNR